MIDLVDRHTDPLMGIVCGEGHNERKPGANVNRNIRILFDPD